jgi:hypothetical protein
VVRQDYRGGIEHLVVGDSSVPLHTMEQTIIRQYPHVRLLHIDMKRYTGQFLSCYAPSRIGFIRNWQLRGLKASIFASWMMTTGMTLTMSAASSTRWSLTLRRE